MGSVVFTDTYSQTGYNAQTQNVRLNYSESYNASTNATTVSLDSIDFSTTLNVPNCPFRGAVDFNSTNVIDMPSSTVAYNVSGGSGSYGTVSQSYGVRTITVPHNADGTASFTAYLKTASSSGYNTFGIQYDTKYWGVRTPVSKTVSLTKRTSTLTVNPNGGTWGGSSSSQNFSQAPTSTKSIGAPSRTGYTFAGWVLSGGGSWNGTTYTFGASNGTLTANWTINSYNVDLMAGDHIASVSGGGSKNYGSSVTVEAVLASATGYTYAFDGWYSGDTKVSGGNPYTFTMPASAVALTAKGTRSANPYTVHFDANGGTGTMPDESFTYDQAKALTANSFTRTGYTFLGWSTNSSAVTPTYSDEQSVSNLAPSGTVTLYAIWQLNTYQLSISTSYGSVSVVRDDSPIGSGSIGALSNGATLYYNDELTITFTAATGYTISTHTVNGSTFTSGNTFIATGAVTIVQTSTANTYTVVFNANRGTGSGGGTMANQAFTYDVEQNLTANAFTRYYTATFDPNGGVLDTLTQDVYCSFTGWSKTSDGYVEYTNQQSVKNLAPSGSVTLYAKWQYGRVVFPEPTRTGFTFRGWYNAPVGGSKISNAGGSVQLFQNATYYAQWDAITYPLSLTSSDNGVVVNVLRTASPYAGGSTGLLNDGATLYYGDALSITFAISEGYQKRSATVNGTDFGGEYSGSTTIASVQSTVTVVVEVKLGAIVYVGNEAYQAFIGNADASAYEQYEGFFGNAGGTDWDAY